MSHLVAPPSSTDRVPLTLENLEKAQDAWNFKNERLRKNIPPPPLLDSPRSLAACQTLGIDPETDLRKLSLRAHLSAVLGRRDVVTPYENEPLARLREATAAFADIGVNMGTSSEKLAALERFRAQERSRGPLLARAQHERRKLVGVDEEGVSEAPRQRRSVSVSGGGRGFSPGVDGIGEMPYVPRDPSVVGPNNFAARASSSAGAHAPLDDPAGVITPISSIDSTPMHSGGRSAGATIMNSPQGSAAAPLGTPKAAAAAPPADATAANAQCAANRSVASVGSSQMEWMMTGDNSAVAASPDVRRNAAPTAQRCSQPEPQHPQQPQPRANASLPAAPQQPAQGAAPPPATSPTSPGEAPPLTTFVVPSNVPTVASNVRITAVERQAGFFYYCANPTSASALLN